MNTLHLSTEESPSQQDLDFLLRSLRDFNIAQTQLNTNHDVAFFVRDSENKIRGGIHARVSWGMLEVKFFWIEESLRGKGFGTQLLKQAEDYARSKGCNGVFLDTFSFQAPDFYQKLGYEIFGTLDGYTDGHRRCYLKKLW